MSYICAKDTNKKPRVINAQCDCGIDLMDEINCSHKQDTEFEFEYDQDSSPAAWRYYQNYYIPKHWLMLKTEKWPLTKNLLLDLKKLTYVYDSKNKIVRLLSESDSDDPRLKGFKLGGDCDFNFKQKCKEKGATCNYRSDVKCPYQVFACKYQLYRHKLRDDDEAGIEMLDRCVEMHHKLLNFSIMPKTGGMQLMKGMCTDRLDKFVYLLESYYKGNPEAGILVTNTKSNSNKEFLRDYLDRFIDKNEKANIYSYCRTIYFLVDKSGNTDYNFVDDLVEAGKSEIRTSRDVKRYMRIAMEFWEKKKIGLEYVSNL
jgi:hypothetical protein